jgi:hypothetical protein
VGWSKALDPGDRQTPQVQIEEFAVGQDGIRLSRRAD